MEGGMEITLEVPDGYSVDYDPPEMGRRIKLYAALLMFQSGEISAGAATELAGVDRYTFAVECQRRGIPLASYPSGDLANELAALRTKAE
jgi:predicted HTH domain antitoxin